MIEIGTTPENLQPIKTPGSFSVTLADLDASEERNLMGYVVRDRIGVKRKLSLGYRVLTQQEIAPILQALENVFFYVRFPDPKEGTVTMQCYVSDRSANLLHSEKKLWSDLKFDFTER